MENNFEREGFDNSLFMKEKREESVREDRSFQVEQRRAYSHQNSNGEQRTRRSYNPNFNSENRVRTSYNRGNNPSSRYENNNKEQQPWRGDNSNRGAYPRRDDERRPSFQRRGNEREPQYPRREYDSRSSYPRREYDSRQLHQKSDYDRVPSYQNREENGGFRSSSSYSRQEYQRPDNYERRNDYSRPSYNRDNRDSSRRDNEQPYRSYNDREFKSERGSSYNDNFKRREYSGNYKSSDFGDRPQRRPRIATSRQGERERRPIREKSNIQKQNKAPYFAEPLLNKELRLNRFIAMSGVCSRRDADDIIAKGLITINGEVVTEMGSKVNPNDVVCYNNEVIKGERLVYIVMNKPRGVVTTLDDPHAEMTVINLLNGKVSERVFPVGRLDKNSLGVILLTNDGDLAKELSHPSHEKKKIYHVFVDKDVTEEHMEKLAEGVELEDGISYADEVSYVKNNLQEIGIEIHSGKNRIVRRMFEHLGYKVSKLDRVYFAGLTKKNLKRGMWRYLNEKEVMALKGGCYN